MTYAVCVKVAVVSMSYQFGRKLSFEKLFFSSGNRGEFKKENRLRQSDHQSSFQHHLRDTPANIRESKKIMEIANS